MRTIILSTYWKTKSNDYHQSRNEQDLTYELILQYFTKKIKQECNNTEKVVKLPENQNRYNLTHIMNLL